MRRQIYHLFYLIACILILTACKKGESSDPTPAPTTATVTIDNYNAITTGMSYAQVVALLGQGTQVNATTYTWSADNTNTITIAVVFANNLVQTKNQVGLASPSGGTSGGTTSGGCPATYNGHTVYTGPRGGCYYINSKGNKTYI